MAPPTTTSAANQTTPVAPAGLTSRSRPQAARKRAQPLADDAAYHGSTSVGGAGTKRVAAERVEGEPRVKRKRVDASGIASGSANMSMASGASLSASANAARRDRMGSDGEGKLSLVDFSALPTSALHEYLVQYDLVPEIDPSPLTADDPPPPSSLLRPRIHARRHVSTASPGPSLPVTPANRPRRDLGSRRRSARLVEDDQMSDQSVIPILADLDELHTVLAKVAERHFREHTVKEVDALSTFMCAVRAKARMAS